MYPDHFGSGMEAGWVEYAYFRRYAEAERQVAGSLKQQNPMRGYAYAELGLYLLAQERFGEAASAFEASQAASGLISRHHRGDLYAAQREFAAANRTSNRPSSRVVCSVTISRPGCRW